MGISSENENNKRVMIESYGYLKEQILVRINKIKSEEDGFKSKWWESNFVSYSKWVRKAPPGSNIPHNTCEEYTKHISEVDFGDMTDSDLVRLFEYVILTRSDISTNRIKQTYFKD